MPTHNPNSRPVTHKVSENGAYNRDAYKALMEPQEVQSESVIRELETAEVQPR